VTRYLLDPGARRADGGHALVAGSPLKIFRLTPAGARIVDAIAAGDAVEPRPFVERLVDAGVVHPLPGDGPFAPAHVTAVIPTRGRPVAALVASLRAEGVARVVVVDDASPIPVEAPAGAELVRHAVNLGPAAARSTGLALVRTALVAFLDDDTEPSPGWLPPLLGHFADRRVALVAPRVRARPGPGRLARYEQARSPLDLGPAPGRVRARTRIAYVPAAALVARTEALRGVGGFDTELRVGEDVDLVWRLDEAGHRLRYEPGAEVCHEVRTGLGAWLAQRYAYGTSAAPLAARHHEAVAPLGVSGWSALAWGLAAAGWPAGGIAVTATTTGLLARLNRADRHA